MCQFLAWAHKGQRVCTERADRLYPRTTFSLCNIHLSFLVLLCPFNWFRVQRVCNGWAVLKPGCLGPELVKQHHPVLVVSKARIQTQLHNAHDQVLLLWHRGQGGADPSSPARRQLWLWGWPDPDFWMARRAQGGHYLWPAADASLGWSGAGTVNGNCQVGGFSPFNTNDIIYHLVLIVDPGLGTNKFVYFYHSIWRRFVARRAGLAGKTDLEFVQADMVCLRLKFGLPFEFIWITFWSYLDLLHVIM